VVLLNERIVAGLEINGIEVVEFWVAVINPNKDTIADCPADPNDHSTHPFQWSEVPCRAGLGIDGENMKILVAFLVLQIDEVASVIGPLIEPDAPFAIIGDRLRSWGASLGPTQTLSTPSTGASHASRWPSGLIRAEILLGLPNKCALGIRMCGI
jgi:hypothetical protein